MRKYGVISAAALVFLAFEISGCNTNIEPVIPSAGEHYGKQTDGSYIIDPSNFTVWYGAFMNGDTIQFSGGGVYYLFPAGDFNINEYDSLVISYTTSGATLNSGDHLEITVKAITNNFTALIASGGDYGTDITYQWLPGSNEQDQLGDGDFTIDASTTPRTFAAFKNTDIVGLCLQASGPITSYNLKINSMTFMPPTP